MVAHSSAQCIGLFKGFHALGSDSSGTRDAKSFHSAGVAWGVVWIKSLEPVGLP